MEHLKHRSIGKYARRILSIVLMLATVLCTMSVITGAEGEDAVAIEMTDAVFVTTTVKAGTRFTSDNLEVRQIPAYNAP